MNSVNIPTILVGSGSRTANPEEYQELLEVGSPDMEDRLMLNQLLIASQELTDVPMVAGNNCQLLIDGNETFDSIFEDIRRARHSIYLETFILENDRVGMELADHLVDARSRGVAVHILIDAIGSFELPSEYIQSLEEKGIELRKFNPVTPVGEINLLKFNNRDHRKLMVVDGRVAYTGGINISGVYSEGSLSVSPRSEHQDNPWRDTHVRITGPVVRHFQKHFLQMWNAGYETAPPPKNEWRRETAENSGDMVVGVFTSQGGDGNTSDIYAVTAASIGHAQERIWITQAYFAPDDTLIELLVLAAQRGVDVRLILPGVSDAPLILQASRSIYQKLLESGVRIYERNHSVLHAKTLVVDGVWSSIGSANYDYRSFIYNYEINAVIVSRKFGREMEEQYQKDLSQAEVITLQSWGQRSLLQRLKEVLGNIMRRWL